MTGAGLLTNVPVLIIDLEATCDVDPIESEMEIIEIVPVNSDFTTPIGSNTAVIFAGQGVINHTPIDSGRIPIFSAASRRAIRAAISTGASTGERYSISSGNLTSISRTDAGQADEMTGRLIPGVRKCSRSAAVAISAPRATSTTLLKPSRCNPARIAATGMFLSNWAYSDGAASAIL